MNDLVHPNRLAAPDPLGLLQQYQAGASYFSSSTQTCLASGTLASLQSGQTQPLWQSAGQLLQDAVAANLRQIILLGALPFDSAKPAHLHIPRSLQLVPKGPDCSRLAMPTPPSLSQQGLHSNPAPAHYQDLVRRALDAISAGQFEKVVLARSLLLQAKIELAPLLRRLNQRNPLGYTFALVLSPEAGGTTLIGASPELLLAKQGLQIRSHPLAGSIPRLADPQQDEQRSQALLRSRKDLYEHALVVDAVVQTLQPFCRSLKVPKGPSLSATPTMWHLGTEISGELKDGAVSSLQLAQALHPTPAVCGHPRQIAHDFIDAYEGFERDWFAGCCGWMNTEGDGEWAVTLRCAEVGPESARLFAGAGIVADSDPLLELRETEAKLATMLQAMGVV